MHTNLHMHKVKPIKFNELHEIIIEKMCTLKTLNVFIADSLYTLHIKVYGSYLALKM